MPINPSSMQRHWSGGILLPCTVALCVCEGSSLDPAFVEWCSVEQIQNVRNLESAGFSWWTQLLHHFHLVGILIISPFCCLERLQFSSRAFSNLQLGHVVLRSHCSMVICPCRTAFSKKTPARIKSRNIKESCQIRIYDPCWGPVARTIKWHFFVGIRVHSGLWKQHQSRFACLLPPRSCEVFFAPLFTHIFISILSGILS